MSRPTAEFLRAISAFRRYAHPERLADWEQRFAFGLADIEQVFEAQAVGEPLLHAPSAPITERFPAGRYSPSPAEGELVSSSATQIASQVRNNVLSPVKIAEVFLARIEAHRHLNAFITVKPDLVMTQAQVLAERLKRGEDPGPLAGVPVGVKDLMSVQGYPLTAGTKAIEARIQQRDAPVVARLRAAGALIVGTTNLHELAFGINSANPHFGHVQNPRYPGHIPGGSSGGSAAAVAGGLAAIAVGTCTGGSIRQPAACCGIVGFKPTYDAVPREGVYPLAWSLDHIGPFARSVEDAALVLSVMADAKLEPAPVDAPRLAIGRQLFDRAEPDLRRHLEGVVERLAQAGARVTELTLPPAFDGIHAAGTVVLEVEAAAYHQPAFAKYADDYGSGMREMLQIGLKRPATEYVNANRARIAFREAMIPLLEAHDALLSPTAPGPAPAGLGWTGDASLCAPWSSAGVPSISVPTAVTASGLPLALQLIQAPSGLARLLGVAAWCERVLGFAERPRD